MDCVVWMLEQFFLITWELDLCTLRRLPLGVSGVERGVGWSETKKSPCSLICGQNEKEEKKEERDRGRGRSMRELVGGKAFLTVAFFYRAKAQRALHSRYIRVELGERWIRMRMMWWMLKRKRLRRWSLVENEGGEWEEMESINPTTSPTSAGPSHSQQRISTVVTVYNCL